MRRITIGIVGLNFGRHIIDRLRNSSASELLEIVAVCDMDRAKASATAEQIGARAYFDLGELLGDTNVEAVGLFTGPVGRAQLIRRIIKSGRHVMTTKPFELDPAEALKVLNEARELGRVLHLNSPSPLMAADLLQVQAWQKQYQLGRPVGCRRSVTASYREQADGTWYDDPAKCPVAPIYRLGIYCINDMVRLLGEAEKVSVLSSRVFTQRPTADNAQLNILFKNGAIGSVFASFCVDNGQPYSNSMAMDFENGSIFRNVGPVADKGSRMSMIAKAGGGKTINEEVALHDASGEYQWEVFACAVRGETLTGEVTAHEIVEGIKIIAAMKHADESGAVELV